MKKVILLALLLSAMGCQIPPKPITGPDGTTHQLLSCLAIENCYNEAAQICSGQYQIINTSNEASGDLTIIKLLVKCSAK